MYTELHLVADRYRWTFEKGTELLSSIISGSVWFGAQVHYIVAKVSYAISYVMLRVMRMS